MKIKEKIKLDYNGLIKYGPINIVAFGDSVTHGAVAGSEINYETVYWNRLRKKILEVSNYIPVNVINAGIGGITSWDSVERMDSQVLSHNPDLVIVCFGLNDVNGELDRYLSALGIIFDKCIERDVDVIFLTPNMLNTYVADDTEEEYMDYAAKTAEVQNSGRMDRYIYSAVKLAQEKGVAVCDCYSKWKKLAETEDVTMLLANRINHPIKEMHELFAQLLFDIIFEEKTENIEIESTMFRENR
ncbi:MAG: GDSL-type esterase/lipase family protein [Clostridia bacterium]|nr:GDSL-type esterase/lipase family protein [Clostridia bacterium]